MCHVDRRAVYRTPHDNRSLIQGILAPCFRGLWVSEYLRACVRGQRSIRLQYFILRGLWDEPLQALHTHWEDVGSGLEALMRQQNGLSWLRQLRALQTVTVQLCVGTDGLKLPDSAFAVE